MGKLKVLVVDDEKPARETLSFLIDWKATDFEIVATAKNGREALEMFFHYQPELIITDIQMPIMDGIALIKAIKQSNHIPKFVILSCHEQFSYARAAIQMGVTDYLIKDLITPQDLYTVLVKVKTELEEQKMIPGNRVIKESQNDEFHDAAKTLALKAVTLEERATANKQALIQEFKLDLIGNNFVLLSVCLEKKAVSSDYSTWIIIEKSIDMSIESALKARAGGECFYYQNGEYVVIAKLEDSVSEFKYISMSYEIAHCIYGTIQETHKFNLTIGISRRFSGFDEAARHYKEAQEVAKCKALLGKEKIFFYNTVLSKVHSLKETLLDKRVKLIDQALAKNDSKTLALEVRRIYQEDLEGYVHYSYLKEINAQMYGLIMAACSSSKIRNEELFKCNYIPIQQVEELDSAEEIGEWFIKIFSEIITKKTRLNLKKYNRHVNAAIDYIMTNYRRDFGLSEIADAINIHKVYLCRLFKHETGDNLVNYKMKVRIAEAKRLMLDSDTKLYKIAEQVGYNNVQQFSAAFKKMTGVTPSEYRDSVR